MTSVYLVRHAKALSRDGWVEPDHLRPLTKAGRRQAEALRTRLGPQPLARLVSSPHVRCVQTLEPLAESSGLAIERCEELAEGSSARGALALVLGLASVGEVAACTHGDVLLGALAELRAGRVPLEGPLECRKASAWVLDVEAGAFRRARYVEPPLVDRARP